MSDKIQATTLDNSFKRLLLWERGAQAAPEDVATPTITTIKPLQGDKDVSRTKGQSNESSGCKDTNNLLSKQENVVYIRHTTDKQSAEIVEASLLGEHNGTTPSTSMNAPTQQ